MYHLQQDCPGRPRQPAGPRYPGFREGRGWAREWPCPRVSRLDRMMSSCPIVLSHVHVFTSFCDLGKCQACAALKVDVLAVNKRAERIQRFAGKEVGLGSLQITL
jgi:hypothetical protein